MCIRWNRIFVNLVFAHEGGTPGAAPSALFYLGGLSARNHWGIRESRKPMILLSNSLGNTAA